MIKNVCAKNFKAFDDFNLELPSRVLFCGENGSGKSSTIEAIFLAITGGLPGIPSKDIFKVARRAENVNKMNAGVTLGDGFSCTRTWTRKRKLEPATDKHTEKISQEIEVYPEKKERILADFETRIRNECGIDPVIVDVSEFLFMSDDKRRDFFFLLGGAQDLKAIDFKQYVEENASNLQLGGKAQKEWDKLLIELDKWVINDLDTLLGNLATMKSAANSNVQLARNTAQKLTEIMAQRQTMAGRLEELKRELAGARENLSIVREKIAKADSLAQTIQIRDDGVQDLIGRIKMLEDERKKGIDLKAQEQTLQNLKLELEKVEKHYVEVFSTREEQIKAARDEEVKTQAAKIEAKERLANALGYRNLLNQIKEGNIGNQLSKFSMAVIENLHDDSESDLKQLTESVKETEKTWLKVSKRESKLETDLGFLKKEYRVITDDTKFRIKQVEDILATDKKRRPEIEQELNKLKMELQALKGKKLEEPSPVDSLVAQRDGLQTRINELESQVEAKLAEENDTIQQQGSLIDSETASMRLYCIKQMIGLLGPKGLKGKLVANTLDPVRDEVRECLKLFGYDCDFDFCMMDGRGNEVFQFGWKSDGQYIDFDSLSTGQQTILLASLTAVICKHTRSPLKFLALDNLEVISSDYEEKFFNGLPAVADFCDLENLIAVTSKNKMPSLKELSVLYFPLVAEIAHVESE